MIQGHTAGQGGAAFTHLCRQWFTQRDFTEHILYASPVLGAGTTRVSKMGMVLPISELAICQERQTSESLPVQSYLQKEVQAAREYQKDFAGEVMFGLRPEGWSGASNMEGKGCVLGRGSETYKCPRGRQLCYVEPT